MTSPEQRVGSDPMAGRVLSSRHDVPVDQREMLTRM